MNQGQVLATRNDRVNGLRIFARCKDVFDSQRPTPLVLVHGLGVSSRYMVPLASLLAKDMPVYAPDLPGYGKSQKPAQPYSINQLAETLKDWMDVIGLRDVYLLGNSMGCQVITQFAVRYPARVKKVILDSPTVDIYHGGMLKQITHALYDLPYEPLTLFPIILHDYLAAGPVNVLKVLNDAMHYPMVKQLPKVQSPALVIRGSYDTIVSQKWTEQVARLLPDARLEVVENSAHAGNFDTPDELAGLARNFLQPDAHG